MARRQRGQKKTKTSSFYGIFFELEKKTQARHQGCEEKKVNRELDMDLRFIELKNQSNISLKREIMRKKSSPQSSLQFSQL